MTTQLDDAFSIAALNETERRVIERLLGSLQTELGEDLLTVWLYGSRARGEANPSETDPDRRSDVDLIAIVGPGRDASEVAWEVQPQLEAIADAEGDSPVYYSLRFYDAEFLRERRAIRDFFFQEVDRDKLVLAGGDLDGEEYRCAHARRSSSTKPATGWRWHAKSSPPATARAPSAPPTTRCSMPPEPRSPRTTRTPAPTAARGTPSGSNTSRPTPSTPPCSLPPSTPRSPARAATTPPSPRARRTRSATCRELSLIHISEPTRPY